MDLEERFAPLEKDAPQERIDELLRVLARDIESKGGVIVERLARPHPTLPNHLEHGYVYRP